jgi:predicted O-linked N-acetylglucosamine transferase (SPINDLY family)
MAIYMTLHHQVDICLDTFPYNGGTTTCHAMWMGIPTLTMAGQTPASRSGATMLSHVGLENLIADHTDDFVNKGLNLANDLEQLAQIRRELRTRFSLSAYGQPELIAKSLEYAFRLMWQRWCDDLPPMMIDVTDTQISTADSDIES